MTLGALLGLTDDPGYLVEELEKLHLDGYRLSFQRIAKNAVMANHVNVLVADAHEHVHDEDGGHCHEQEHCDEHCPEHEHCHVHEHSHEHGHSHGHEHDHGHEHSHENGHTNRSFGDIRKMIEESGLAQETKELALRIFTRVARAEAKVHGKGMNEVQFHEVGAVDSIVDIVGCAILITQIAPDRVYSSVIHEGHGFIRCQHGLLSVPVPAVSEIFADAQMPLQQIDIDTELVTPTGAAIITELTGSYGGTEAGLMPPLRPEKIGWGAGTKVLPIPNLLKVTLGNLIEDRKTETLSEGFPCASDEIVVLETNLDDCGGEVLGYAMEQLLLAGALDVFFTPIHMKKNRPGVLLTVLSRPEDAEKQERLIFLHTTTIGIRRRTEQRAVLNRAKEVVKTPYGELEVKKVLTPDGIRSYPEYDSAAKLAAESGRSLWEVYQSYEKLERVVSESI